MEGLPIVLTIDNSNVRSNIRWCDRNHNLSSMFRSARVETSDERGQFDLTCAFVSRRGEDLALQQAPLLPGCVGS